jgi:Zn-dependent protease/CBS domain-containing protein
MNRVEHRDDSDERRLERQGARELGGGFRLGRIFGVAVYIDPSLLIIFGLITLSLGWGVFPRWHPEWGAPLTWLVALSAAILFLVSVLAHEMAHALVGRRHGIEVRRITLFLFGGMAHMENEPPTPKSELWMAIVGPITSIAIGVGSIALAWAIAPAAVAELAEVDAAAAVQQLGPASTLLLWLGPINVLLGLFNMVPGFPLDGGRVFRAIVWWITGDLRKATRWASNSGRYFGYALIGAGVLMILGVPVPIFGRGLVSGLWLVFIGWFLSRAATASYRQLVIREALSEIEVADLMRRRIIAVPADASVADLVAHAYETDQESFPVVVDGRMVGIVPQAALLRVPAENRVSTRVATIMLPVEAVPTVGPHEGAQDALTRMQQTQRAEIPVIDRGHLLGLLRLQDVFRWLALYGKPDANAGA